MNWKPLETFNGRYQVSSNGEVRSLITNRILRPAIDGWGYKRVAMMRDGKLVTQKVHRLVAIAFIPNPGNKPTVNHKNGIKTDNRVDNLEWATQSENFCHALKNGLITLCKEETHYKSRPTIQYTLDMQFVAEWPAASAAARSLGVDPGNILSCLCGKRNKAYGFKWQYK